MLAHLLSNISLSDDKKTPPKVEDGLQLLPHPVATYRKKKQVKVAPREELLNYAPWFVSQLRFPPDTAAYILYKWLDKVEVNVDPKTLSVIKIVLAWRTGEYQKTKLENWIGKSQIPKLTEPRQSYMPMKFPPPPPFPKLNLNVINKILNDAELPSATNTNSLAGINHLVQQLEQLCGVSEISRWRFRKRPNGKSTSVGVYKSPLSHKERKAKLHKSLHHFRKYNKALEQAGRLRGRLYYFQSAYVTRTCAKIDKSGLLTQICTNYNFFDKIDVATAVFVALASSEFSVRKGFTLETQQQGALDLALEYIYKNILIPSKTTDWALIASVYPLPTVISHVSKPELLELLEEWLVLQIPLAEFLNQQWEKGVDRCAEKGMMVPRKPANVDTGGWNRVCGTWNNLVRSVRSISQALVTSGSPMLIKCMKLLAADQIQWAQMSGKEEQVDIRVFTNLARKGITCWNVVLGKCVCTEDDVLRACQEEKVDPIRWLGKPQERRKETKETFDMICGVPVPADVVLQNFMKSLGFYGYKPYQNK